MPATCLYRVVPPIDRPIRIRVYRQLNHSFIHGWRFASKGQSIPKLSKAQARANQFRERTAEILKDSGWLDEGVLHWLNKQLSRDRGYIYTENEHAALDRIVAAGKLFDGWDGYSVPELLAAASRYKRDGDYEDERFLDALEVRNPQQLRLREMGHLTAICRNFAGLPVAPFRPPIMRNDDLA
jgi:hypothetical protein